MIDFAAQLPDGISTGLFWALNVASFFGSFITAGFGIGGGALVLAILATLLPPAALIPVHGIVQFGSNVGRTIVLWRHIARFALPWFIVGSLIGSALGGALVVELSPRWVQAGVGVFIIYSVLAKPPAWLKRWPALTGTISSFLTMFFGATGLFVAGFTKSLRLGRYSHVATHGALMSVQHGLKVLVFGLLGFAFGTWWLVILGMIVAGVAGTLCGKMLLDRLSDLNFRRALDAVLILISLRLIWVALAGD